MYLLKKLTKMQKVLIMIKECNKSIQQKRMHKKRAGIYNAKKKKN